jgi:acid phosphatase family membrane protein YuiD
LVGFPAMEIAAVLAMTEAVSKDIGLLATFLGIGLIVNVIVVFIVVLVRGEHQQNRER